jgi:hypothetical protein
MRPAREAISAGIDEIAADRLSTNFPHARRNADRPARAPPSTASWVLTETACEIAEETPDLQGEPLKTGWMERPTVSECNQSAALTARSQDCYNPVRFH